MKNSFILTIAAVLTAITCSAQPSQPNNIREKLNAFVESKEYGVQKLSYSKDGFNVYLFAQQFAMAGEPDDHYYGPLFTPKMRELETAYRTEAVNAKTIYIHDASEGDSPLSGVKFQFKTDAAHPMSQSVSFDLNKNIRLISFEEPNGRIYALLLMWDQYVYQDKKIGDTFLMDGMIYEISGWKLDDRPFIAHYKPKAPESEGLTYDAQVKYDTTPDAMTVDVFMAKVKRTCEIFKRETPQGRMAAGVVLNKTCNAFAGKLTKEQYFDLLSSIQPLVDNEKNENLKSILAYSCYLLYKKSEIYEGDRDTDVTHASAGTSESTTSQVSKTIVYNSMLMNELVEKDMVECKISGTAPLSGKEIAVCRNVTLEPMGSCPVVDGKFSFTCKLPKNEICRIYLDNRNAVFFYTDGKPINVDMEKLTVRSDKASQKINDFLQLVERERMDELFERDSLKKAKINRQRGERLLKAVRDNRDNILSAFALSQVYTEMSYEELKPYLNDDYAFSHHILLSPMREYMEGLEKRKPGTHYINLKLVDTKGRPHQLSEYIGKGYVVLHFWHGLGGYGYRIHPSMKTVYDTYNSRGVEFVTLAFGFGVQGWREEVAQRHLPWPQLMPDPDTSQRDAAAAYGIRSYPELIVIDSKGTIVACPRNVEELSSVLNKLK
jgi:hypothetical protein